MRKIIYFLLLIVFFLKGYFEPVSEKNPSFWSFLPALSAVTLTLLEKNPLFSLGYALLSGFFLLGVNFINLQKIFLLLFSKDLAYVLLLYGVLLGSLLGLWQSFGIVEAFANYLSQRYIKTARSAKLVSWILGVLFFQGGTLSAVVIGSTVKPVADKVKVSHEELSYIVDSTSAPVALIVPLNAWPYYIQNFLILPIFLSLDDKLLFYYKSIPFFFYAIFAIFFALLLALDRFWLAGKKMYESALRARSGKGLDSQSAKPLLMQISTKEKVGKPWDFPLALMLLLLTVVFGIFFKAQIAVILGFSFAFLFSLISLFFRTSFFKILTAVFLGLKNNLWGCLLLTLAIILGKITTYLGVAPYLIKKIPSEFPLFLLPALFFLLSSFIATATGTSWGTYALLLPTTMPLAYEVSQNFIHNEIFLMLSFAAILNGSVFGDHISPISDTTILSSMATGADLSDHVATQLVPATRAAFLSLLLYLAFGYWIG